LGEVSVGLGYMHQERARNRLLDTSGCIITAFDADNLRHLISVNGALKPSVSLKFV
jgi:hypothetical protein